MFAARMTAIAPTARWVLRRSSAMPAIARPRSASELLVMVRSRRSVLSRAPWSSSPRPLERGLVELLPHRRPLRADVKKDDDDRACGGERCERSACAPKAERLCHDGECHRSESRAGVGAARALADVPPRRSAEFLPRSFSNARRRPRVCRIAASPAPSQGSSSCLAVSLSGRPRRDDGRAFRRTSGPRHPGLGARLGPVHAAEIVTQPGHFALTGDGLCVGRDSASPVAPEYDPPFRFVGGRIERVVVDVSGAPFVDHEKEVLAYLKRD